MNQSARTGPKSSSNNIVSGSNNPNLDTRFSSFHGQDTASSPSSTSPSSGAKQTISKDHVTELPRFSPQAAQRGAHARSSSRNDPAHAASEEGSSQTDGTFRHRRAASAAFQAQAGEGAESEAGPSGYNNHNAASLLALRRDHSSAATDTIQLDSSPMVEVPLDSPAGGWHALFLKNKGLAYVLLAQVFGCLMNVTTRLLEQDGSHGSGMHPFQILFVRMTITTILCTLYMWWTSIPHFPFGIPEVRWLLALRGLGSFFGVFGMYYSLIYLPLADATVITFISPSLSCFACAILLREPFTRMEQLGALISFLGVTLIARPTTFLQIGHPANAPTARAEGPDDHFNSVTSAQRFGAVCVALVGVLGQAMAFTTMRWVGKRAHPLLSVNYFSICCTLLSASAMTILPSIDFILPANFKQWGFLIFLGICGFLMQFLLSAGLQHEKSSRATNMVYTQMIFALFFDKVVFGTNPSLLSLVGSSLILGSAIYVAMQKETLKQRDAAQKQRALEEAAANRARSNSNAVEMHSIQSSRRDEERGLVAGMDADDD